MASATLPRKPVENWEQIRDQWVADVEQFMNQVEEWARKQGWSVLRESKTIVEDRIGSYEVPWLVIHDPSVRVLLDPEARFVAGADGRIDFTAVHAWDGFIVIRDGSEWVLVYEDAEGPKSPWSEGVFVDAVHRLVPFRFESGLNETLILGSGLH